MPLQSRSAFGAAEASPSGDAGLMQLLLQLATLPAEQRVLLVRLLTPPLADTSTPARPSIDDRLPHGYEAPEGETG